MADDARDHTAADVLAEVTGDSVDRFTPPEDIDYPALDGLDTVEADDPSNRESAIQPRER